MSSSLILCNNNELFLKWIVMCDEKWILYQIDDGQLSGWARKSSKALPQTELAPKKGQGRCLVVFLPVWSFWILLKPLHLRSRLNKLMRCAKNCKASSQHWSAELVTSSSPWQHPTAHCTSNASENKLDCEILPHRLHSSDLSPANLGFFKHLDSFLQGKCLQNQQEVENAFQEFTESWSMDFYASGINQFISHWQKCVHCNSFHFD